MKFTEAAEIIREEWIQRDKGYRVSLERREGAEWIHDMCPQEDEKPLTSEITAWELARRLAKAKGCDDDDYRDGDMVNLFVVNDRGEPIRFYGTNEFHVLNPREKSNK